MVAKTLNILDPQLSSSSGHGVSFIEALVNANNKTDCDLVLWVSGKFEELSCSIPGIVINRHFEKSIRRIQEIILIRIMLKNDERAFWVTASKAELITIAIAASKKIAPKRFFLYFHWLKLHPVKKFLFTAVSKLQPNIEVFGPTQNVVKALKECGFKHASLVPYPITERPKTVRTCCTPFSHLLFAGTVRIDKGFKYVVDLIEYLGKNNSAVNITIPDDGDISESDPEKIACEYSRLKKSGYAHITKSKRVLDATAYFAQFDGGICLQLYCSSLFEDRISGITLDALSMGCPVISSHGTWTARIVEEYDAGIVIDDITAESIMASALRIINDYDRYRANALKAGDHLQNKYDAALLLHELLI